MSDLTLADAAVKLRPPPQPSGLVNTLDRPRFDIACATLMHQVLESYQPDLLVGIRTGGLVVADAMAKAIDGRIPVMPLTCRRASTATKSKIKLLPKVLSALPTPAVDGLRWLEHHLITARRGKKTAPQEIDRAEATAIGHYLHESAGPHRILVVDDAVDSGVTLATVLYLVRNTAPSGTEVRSAVITVTLDQPVAEPDFTLYRGVLCRFPWSFDAAG